MRLLMFTQKVDRADDLLGVYHEWIKELSSRFEEVHVVCLFEGDHDLPSNVRVYSLGKERGAASRWKYVRRFFVSLWKLHGAYDVVFVHMNKEYVLLGSFFWKLFGKKVIFWYNHPYADASARLAFILSDKVLFTSPYAASAKLSHSVRMPVGVEVPELIPQLSRRAVPRILSVGRISKVKNIDLLLAAAAELEKRGVQFVVDIYGAPVERGDDRAYFEALKRRAPEIHRQIIFHGAVPNTEVPQLFEAADVSVNLTKTGSMDKTIFESMARGCPVVTTNLALGDMLDPSLRDALVAEENNAVSVADRVESFLVLSSEQQEDIRKKLHAFVLEKHSLTVLAERLCGLFSALV